SACSTGRRSRSRRGSASATTATTTCASRSSRTTTACARRCAASRTCSERTACSEERRDAAAKGRSRVIRPQPDALEGHGVRLEPLSREHENGLAKAAQDGKLWELWFTSVPA